MSLDGFEKHRNNVCRYIKYFLLLSDPDLHSKTLITALQNYLISKHFSRPLAKMFHLTYNLRIRI